jgi:hypothetical protein
MLQEVVRGERLPIRPGVCRMLDMNFRERFFPDVG